MALSVLRCGRVRQGVGMRINYPEVIEESEAVLGRRERELRGRGCGCCCSRTVRPTSVSACAPRVGFRLRQLRRWWAQNKQSGLVGPIEEQPRPGKASRLVPEAYEALQAQMRLGKIATRSGRPRVPGAGAQHRVRLGQRGTVAATQAQGEAQDRSTRAQALASGGRGGVQKRHSRFWQRPREREEQRN